jgi:hypothetical protein
MEQGRMEFAPTEGEGSPRFCATQAESLRYGPVAGGGYLPFLLPPLPLV